MRVLLLVLVTLAGGVAGFFAGGYGYNALNPVVRPPAPTGPVSLRSLQSVERQVGDALARHNRRQSWIIAGALAGAGTSFMSLVLIDRLLGKNRPRTED
jgi:hypothetical protein